MFRLSVSNVQERGRYGILYNNNSIEICKTVEREYLNNEKNCSALPLGIYDMIWRDSPSQGLRIHLSSPSLGVSHDGQGDDVLRSFAMFHVANHPLQLEGCIAPCQSYGDDWTGFKSTIAVDAFERAVNVFESLAGRMPKLIIHAS